MRVIKSDTGFLYYEKIFKQLMANQCDVVVWQVSENGERQINHTKITAFHMESKKIYFGIQSKDSVSDALPLYCYAEDGPLIFKSSVQGFFENNVCVSYPEEIKLLEEPDVTEVRGSLGGVISDVWRTKRLDVAPLDQGPDYMKVKSMAQRSTRDQDLLNNEFGVSLEEEDKLFADKRESPRARPKDDKWVKVAKVAGNGPQVFKLFDLSRGGLGFITYDDSEFPKGSDIHVVGFNDFDLDDPLVGKVMSIRPIDGTVEFKVGVKFSEGQD